MSVDPTAAPSASASHHRGVRAAGHAGARHYVPILGLSGIALHRRHSSAAFAVFYQVPTKVTGEGILLIEQDTISQVRGQATGRLKSLSVKLGDRVEPGMAIGEISQDDLKDQIRDAEAKLADLEAENLELTQFDAKEKETHENAMRRLAEATEQAEKSSRARS